MPKSLAWTSRDTLVAFGVSAMAVFYFIGHFFAFAETPAKIPADAGGFTAYVADQFRQAIPDATIEIVSPLRLRVKSPRNSWGAYLDTVFDVCVRLRSGCAESVATFVKDMTSSYETIAPPPDRSSLRVVVRPSGYVQLMRNQGMSAPLAVPLQGDLWMIGVLDLPRAINFLDQSALTRLHLSAEEALAIGKQNMSADMREELRKPQPRPGRAIVFLTGNSYESSLFAFPELWASLDDALDGNLLVAVPATDVVLFADGRSPHAVEDLTDAARVVMRTANRPFSEVIFQWDPTGWTLVPPSGQP